MFTTKILFFPGYNGDSNSNMFKEIVAKFRYAKVECVEYDNDDPDIAKATIQKIVERGCKDFDLILAGQSLGGYWANYFASKYKLPCLLINPSLNPRRNLAKRGIDQRLLDKFEDSKYDKTSRILVLAKSDEVVDNVETANKFKGKADIIWIEGGHRLKKYDQVIHNLSNLINNVQEH